MTTQEIYREIVDQYEQGRFKELLEAMKVHWPVLEQSRDGYVGDACRFTMLAARELELLAESRVWRARSLAAYALSDNKRGTAMLVMSEAFAAMWDDRTTNGAAHALIALEEMRPLIYADQAPENVVPTVVVCERVYWEKRGFSLFRLEQFGEATVAYREALKYTRTDSRGATKVKAGLILSMFLAAPNASSRDAAIAGTEEVAEEARRGEWKEIAIAAETNLDLLKAWREGEPAPGFKAYEVL